MPRASKALPRAVHMLACFVFSICSAQEITPQLEVQGTLGKKIYTNAKVISVSPQGVKIVHDDGISVIPAGYLPKEWLEKHAPGALSMPPASTATPAAKDQPQGAPPATRPPPAAGETAATGSQTAAPSGNSFDPSCLVFIKTDTGSGSGFIAKVEGTSYVYTNAHVICGTPGAFTSRIVSIKTASGINVPIPQDLELSDMKDASTENGLEDLARFPITLQEGESAYEISALDPNASMSGNVVAYGNSLGGDVFTSLKGSIVGLGTDRIEVSCEIVPGNSGGPVVLEQSKKVIGVSSYLISGKRDIWAANTQFAEVRRFALRPDKVTKWRKMRLTSMISSVSELTAFDRDTLSLAAACFLNPKPNNAGFDLRVQTRGAYNVQKLLVEGIKYSLGSTINSAMAKVNQRLGAGMSGRSGGTRMAVQGVVAAFADFFNTVAGASAAQMQSLGNADRAPYLKKIIPELIRERQEVHQEFVQQASRFR